MKFEKSHYITVAEIKFIIFNVVIRYYGTARMYYWPMPISKTVIVRISGKIVFSMLSDSVFVQTIPPQKFRNNPNFIPRHSLISFSERLII
jgi:hypothetical protein